MEFARLKRPLFIIDRAKVRRNIERMAVKARQSAVALRPHVKTHQSAAVADWMREFDVKSITVSSVDMAVYFRRAGWDDILISVPVNPHQLPEIDDLAADTDLHVILESPVTARALVMGIRHPLNVWIEIDTGYQRTGIPVDRPDLIARVADVLQGNNRLRFQGLLSHDGQTYAAAGPDEVRSIARASLKAQSEALEILESAGYQDLKLSVGDTPSCSLVDRFPPPVAELRPGNFVFYDLTQARVGACREEDIAAAVACPVIAKYPDRGEFVIYGGGVHISKEALKPAESAASFGKIALFSEGGRSWAESIHGAFVSSLSQEQGTIRGVGGLLDKVQIGDPLAVLPVHACLTANLHSSLFAPGEGPLSKFRL